MRDGLLDDNASDLHDIWGMSNAPDDGQPPDNRVVEELALLESRPGAHQLFTPLRRPSDCAGIFGFRDSACMLPVDFSEEGRDAATRARVDALNLEPWVTEGLDFVVHIRTRTISARRFAAR